MEETQSYFREKAKQCRRLAAKVVNQDDRIAVALRALAEEFEAKAAAQPAEQGGVEKVESRRCVAAASVAAPPLHGARDVDLGAASVRDGHRRSTRTSAHASDCAG
jgi:hypothetical protein